MDRHSLDLYSQLGATIGPFPSFPNFILGFSSTKIMWKWRVEVLIANQSVNFYPLTYKIKIKVWSIVIKYCR